MAQTERAGDTKQLAETAFYAILATGKMATVELVNEWLEENGHGRRNRNAISAQIKDSCRALGRRVSEEFIVPGLSPETVKMVVTLQDHLIRLCKAEFEEDVAKIQREMEATTASAAARVQEIEAKLMSERDASRNWMERYEEQVSELTKVRQSEYQLHAALTKSGAQLAGLQERIAALEADRAVQAQRQIDVQRSHQEAIERESERYRQLQSSLMQQADDERQRAAKLARQLEAAESKARESGSLAVQAERAFAEEKTRLSAQLGEARGRAEMLLAQVTHLQQEVSRQAVELAESRAKNEQLQQDLHSASRKLPAKTRKA